MTSSTSNGSKRGSNNNNNTSSSSVTNNNTEGFSCPVPKCSPDSRGWKNANSLHQHIDLHVTGQLMAGVAVPASYFQTWERMICHICKKTVSAGHKMHKACKQVADQRKKGSTLKWVPRSTSSSSSSSNNNSNNNNNSATNADAVAGDLPSIEQCVVLKVRVLQYVPKRSRSGWGKIFQEALVHVMQANDKQAWTKLFMLPKCILRKPNGRVVGGMANVINFRISKWLNGEHALLWNEALESASAVIVKPGSKKNRAIHLARMGRFGNACAALTKEGLAADNPDTLAELKAKHPEAQRQVLNAATGTPLKVTADVVLNQLKSFPVGSAGGYDGLRPAHILEGVKYTQNRSSIDTLTAFVNWLLAGKAPDNIAIYLAGAPLMACAKKQGGVRPLAIGQAIRRLVSKCVCASKKLDFLDYFKPHQFGVGVSGGAEDIVHCFTRMKAKHSLTEDFVILKIDCDNAFNKVNRTEFLEIVKKDFPDIYHWIRFCYQGAPLLLFNEHQLYSSEGTQQGDPLSPALFSMVLKKLITIVESESPELDLNSWFLDDGVLMGSASVTAKALNSLLVNGPKLGLHLNIDKCEAWWPSQSAVDRDKFPQDIKHIVDGTDCLGVPIGTNDFCRDFFEKKLIRAVDLLQKIDDLEDSQVAFMLISKQPSTLEVFSNFDTHIRNALGGLLGTVLSDEQWAQAGLSIKSGGLGLRSVYKHRLAAYIASLASSAKKVGTILKNTTETEFLTEMKITDHINNFNTQVIPENVIEVGNIGKQSELSERICNKELGTLYQSANNMNKARLKCLTGPLGGGWLQAVPNNSNKLISREFTTLLKLRLGIQVYEQARGGRRMIR